MISTFQALGVAFVALVPGAAYTFAYEREAGAYGVNLADRFVRFFIASAVFHAIFAGPELLIYQHLMPGKLKDVVWWQLELAAIVYIAVPIIAGLSLGRGARNNKDWAAAIVGSARHPRAWDHLWATSRSHIVRARLKSGLHVAGVFEPGGDGIGSYAAGYGEEADLYLSRQLIVDPETGAYEVDPDSGEPRAYDPVLGLLLTWANVEVLHIQPIDSE